MICECNYVSSKQIHSLIVELQSNPANAIQRGTKPNYSHSRKISKVVICAKSLIKIIIFVEWSTRLNKERYDVLTTLLCTFYKDANKQGRHGASEDKRAHSQAQRSSEKGEEGVHIYRWSIPDPRILSQSKSWHRMDRRILQAIRRIGRRRPLLAHGGKERDTRKHWRSVWTPGNATAPIQSRADFPQSLVAFFLTKKNAVEVGHQCSSRYSTRSSNPTAPRATVPAT